MKYHRIKSRPQNDTAVTIERSSIVGLVLAGGRGRRAGGHDKGLIEQGGRPLVEHAAALLRPHVTTLLISANRNQTRYARFADRVVTDLRPGFPGPLAGIEAGLQQAGEGLLLVIPCDAAGLPAATYPRLIEELAANPDSLAAVFHDGLRLQPLIAVIRSGGASIRSVGAALDLGEHAVYRWLDQVPYRSLALPVADGISNLNRPPVTGSRGGSRGGTSGR